MKLAVGYCLIVAALADVPLPATADCQCRANGRFFEQGQVICLNLPNGRQLARCGKELNNSSWKKVRDGCPSAAAAPSTHPVDHDGAALKRPQPQLLSCLGDVLNDGYRQ